MATHTITTDTNIHNIADLADFDTVDIQSGATFTSICFSELNNIKGY